MKNILFIKVILFFNLSFSQTEWIKETTNSNPNYDKVLAEKLGGDKYGMKQYFFVILKTGENKTEDKKLISEKFKGHMENIERLVKLKQLIVAGPFSKNDKNYRGLFLLNNIKTIKDAEELLQSDPAIESRLLDYEIFTWFGSAALPKYLPFSDKIWKTKP